MKQYYKKAIIVEAEQLTIENIDILEKWCGGQIKGTKLPVERRSIDIWIKSIEEEVRANIGDYIIRMPNGDFSCRSMAVFEAIYEKI